MRRLLFSVLLLGHLAIAQSIPSVPHLIKFSGALKTPSGSPLSGVHGLTLAVYKDQQDGSPLWLESQNVELDDQGRYTVLLGASKKDGVPLDLFAANEPRWLGVQVQLPGYQEEPRLLLVSVPYALKAADAETVGGLPVTSFVLTPEAAKRLAAAGRLGEFRTQSATTLPTAATSGTAGFLGVFTDTTNLGNSVAFQSGSNIGIGTTDPSAGKLVVVGQDALVLTSSAGETNLYLKNTDTGGQSWFFASMGSNAGPNAGDLRLYGGNSGSEGLVAAFRPSGYVGVGTTNPQALLDVRKGFSTYDTVNNLALFGYSGSSNRSFGFQQIANATTANQYLFFNGGLGTASTTTTPKLTTPYGYALGMEVVDGAFNFISNPTEGVTNGAVTRGLSYQATSGRVGIGTTTPGEKLEVNGSVKITYGSGGGIVFQDGSTQSTSCGYLAPNPQQRKGKSSLSGCSATASLQRTVEQQRLEIQRLQSELESLKQRVDALAGAQQ